MIILYRLNIEIIEKKFDAKDYTVHGCHIFWRENVYEII